MFRSATLHLTGWYLLILMSISLIFSISIYNITSIEVSDRLRQLQVRFEGDVTRVPFDISGIHNPEFSAFRDAQRETANKNILVALVYVNILILVTGGLGSYFLARRTLRDIEQAHESQSRFTSDASHELRTPLAAMKTELEVALRDTTLHPDEMRELLESNLEEVNKLTHLSHMLLQLSKADFSQLATTEVALAPIVHTVVQRYDKTGTRIETIVANNLPSIVANEPSIEELVTILVDNALKYSPKSSLVSVKASKRSGKVALEITNTGKGIAAADLPHIFDRFYRADSSRTGGDTSGYGLGLALAKKIVEIHHGDLNASSAPDHATTFTVLLPIFRKTKAKTQ